MMRNRLLFLLSFSSIRNAFFALFLLLAPCLFLSSCQVPVTHDIDFTVNAFFKEVPSNKTAAIHLVNDKISRHDLEYEPFFLKLEKILKEKGYRFSAPANVILKLDFGSELDRHARTRSNVTTGMTAHEFNHPIEVLTSVYDRRTIFNKYITITALQAGNPRRQYWKASVLRQDEEEPFRQSEDYLLYLLSLFIEKDTKGAITGSLSLEEFYQRYHLGYRAGEASMYFSLPHYRREVYETALQSRINESAEAFRRCGVRSGTEVRFFVSDFGRLLDFSSQRYFIESVLNLSSLDEALQEAFFTREAEVRFCAAGVLEGLLEPPIGVDNYQPFLMKLP